MNKKPERSKRATPGPAVEERKKYATKKPITEGKISLNVGTSASALKKPSNVSIHTLSSSKEYNNQAIAIGSVATSVKIKRRTTETQIHLL